MGKNDVVWNDYISKNERFADFINGVVFHGEQMVRPETMVELDTKLRRREQERDSYGGRGRTWIGSRGQFPVL